MTVKEKRRKLEEIKEHLEAAYGILEEFETEYKDGDGDYIVGWYDLDNCMRQMFRSLPETYRIKSHTDNNGLINKTYNAIECLDRWEKLRDQFNTSKIEVE